MRAKRGKRRGFALLMVIVVSVALMAIAIPFAISMRHQERGAQGGLDRSQARYAALAARNHALANVVRGHEWMEEGKAVAPFNTPYSDGPEEFQVTWGGAVPARTEEDGTGRLRGAILQDEQGKVNVRTAPQAVIDRVRASVDTRTQDLRDYLTEWSGRPASYGGPQTIRGIVPGTAKDGSDALTLQIDDGNAFAEGAKVRVTWAGVPQYGVVDSVNTLGQDITVTNIGQDASQVGAVVELEIRHPVNINTAPAIVISACLEGLALRNQQNIDPITKGKADAVAAAMIKKRFTSYDDFQKWLGELMSAGTITVNDMTAILLNFANPSARRLAGTGTLPFTLTSDNYVTVVAQGVQDLPSRTISALADIREVVEMAPSGNLRWRTKSQYDFERMLRLPMGRFVVTWPACIANMEPPSTDRAQAAWVTTRLGRDDRANWKIRNHFDNTIAGMSTAKGAFQQDASQILQITNGNVDIEAGAAELWVKTSSNAFTIFDAGTEDWSNRLWFSYGFDNVQGANVLKFVLKDSSLEHTYAEVVHKVTLTPDTWYHLGAFWKGTKFGHAMMTLDGIPVGNYGVWTETGQARHTYLSAAIDNVVNTISTTTSTAGFPSPGAIQIGNEVIEYASASGNSFTGCLRGARGTSGPVPNPPPNPMVPIGWDHQAGAGITVLGYTSRLAKGTLTFQNPTMPTLTWDRLTTGGGKTVGAIGSNTLSYVVTATPSAPPAVGLPQGLAILSVAAPNTGVPPAGNVATEFPPTGWLVVGSGPQGEIVSYTGRTQSGFTGLVRGLFGTTDKNHLQGERIQLWGFHVTDNTNYLTPTVLAIDDEWFGPVIKEGTDGWRGVVIQRAGVTVPLPLFRGPNPFGTVLAAHADGTNVYPTFTLADHQAGNGDTVTFVEKDPSTREEQTIRHVWPGSGGQGIGTPNPGNMLVASLGGFVKKDWVPDNFWVRVLKFPSGELMGVTQKVMTFAGSALPSAPAGFSGLMDELRLTDGPKTLPPIPASIDMVVTTVPMAGVGGMNATGGAVLVGDEIIGYAGIDPVANTLLNCTRGYLGTTAAVHERGDRVFNMAFLTINSLTGAMGATDKSVPCVPTGFTPDGFVLVGTEMIGYTRISPTGLVFPDGCDFRGAFGTAAAAHNQNDLVYAMPFRYYDRFTANSDDSQLAWFGAAHRATGAKWTRISWDEILPNKSLDIQVRVRFNSEPRWANVPTNRPYVVGKGGGIWLFDAPAGGSLGNARGDEIDVRVDFVWLDNAYANGEWKDCAQFRGLAVDYEQEPVVHYHEEK